MKSFSFLAVLSIVLVLTSAAPVRSYYYPKYKSSTAIGGSGGDGGDATAVGANVVAGVGGPAVSGTGKNVNFGYQAGGDGFAIANVANGASGTVVGSGSISGSFS
ncbi:unnamed protein product, partial [Agarophyton chilense]